VHTIGIGAERVPEDIELVEVELPQVAPPEVELTGSVLIRSSIAGPATLRVYDEDRILRADPIELPGGDLDLRHELRIPTGNEGLRVLRIAIGSEVEERNTVNNERRHVISVTAREPRILYVEGEPRWEYKFIRRALDLQQGLQLHSLLQTSTNNWYRQGIAGPDQLKDGVPAQAQELYAYDAIIIGSQPATSFMPAQLALLKSFVSERGGSLLMLGGREGLADGAWRNTPVADVLPVYLPVTGDPTFDRRMASFRPTAAGLRAAWLRFSTDDAENLARWDKLPQIADFQRIGEPKPGATVLIEQAAEGAPAPLLVTQRYGRGQSFILATGGTWRWQMQLPLEDDSHEGFWQRFAQELVRPAPQRVSFSTDRAWYVDEQRVGVRARVLNADFAPETRAQVGVTATAEDGTVQQQALRPVADRPGDFETVLDLPAQGLARLDFTARAGSADPELAQLFVARDDGRREYFGAGQNRALLERIAQRSGGQYWTTQTLDDLPAQLRYSAAGITRVEHLPLWNMPINFLVLLALKLVEWLLRRRWGHL
jgi:uncharacterized membrane protein